MASVVHATNAVNDSISASALNAVLESILDDLQALNAAVAAITAQMDTNALTGHPYSKAETNPTLVTTN